MHLAILTNEYPPHIYGGAGIHVENLTRQLLRLAAAENHHLTILCFGDQKESQPHLTVQGIGAGPALEVPEPRHRKLLDTLQRNLRMAAALTQADLIHCHTWYTHLAGCLLKQLLQAPLVLTTHSLEPQRPWKAEQLGRGYFVSTWVEETAYRHADGVIAVSQAMRQDVHDLYGVPWEKIRVIYNGVDTDTYRPQADPQVLAAYGIDAARPYILFVGRITRQKGIFHLLNALEYLSGDLQVVLCAADPDTPEYREGVAARVAALQARGRPVIWVSRFVPHQDLIRLYSQAAVFVCPSIYEPFGIINLEAMACGTPVVGAAVGGIREVIRHGETGLLVPFEPVSATDPEPRQPEQYARDLAAAIERLLHQPELRQKMGRRARQVVEEHFSWSSIARQTLEFYKELARKS